MNILKEGQSRLMGGLIIKYVAYVYENVMVIHQLMQYTLLSMGGLCVRLTVFDSHINPCTYF